ncbi:hypothetical protein HOY82DRAFT_631666 [Tuber indicum]|nr:hypothetical protein HOY82DRAFT_631666 [Tuber indicum]
MNYQPYASGSHNRSYYRSEIPQIHLQVGQGSRTPRPAQMPLPTAPSLVPQTPVAPHLCNHHVTNPKGQVPPQREQVPAILSQESRSTESQKCIERFKRWQSHKGRYDSPGYGEKGLTMKISIEDFISFKKGLNFNSLSSILKFTQKSSTIHEGVVETISEGFTLARDSHPESMMDKVRIVRNQRFTGFDGNYYGSNKTPDAALKIESAAGKQVVKFALEVGLSETYDILVEDAKMWLEGHETVSAVMLFKLEETPDYKCPVRDLDNEQLSQLRFPRWQEITGEVFTLEYMYGPEIYKGLSWVGKITGFIEIWKRDPESGLAVHFGDRVDLIDSSNILQDKFLLSEFLDIANEDDYEIPFKWERCQSPGKRYQTTGC